MELREVKKNFLLKNFLLIKSEKSSKHVAFLADELLKRWDLVSDGQTDRRTDGRTDIISKGDPSSVEIIYANFFLFFFSFTAGLTKIENVFFDFFPTLFLAILLLALSLLALSLS